MKSLHTAATGAALLVLALAVGGCCTPGTVGRTDAKRGLDWTLAQFAQHNRDDWEKTREHVASIPDLVAPSVFQKAAENWCTTCRLYFTGSSSR